MKTCGFEKQMDAYLDGELSGEKLRAFEAHLHECEPCREQAEQYRELLGELRGMEELEVPDQLRQRLHAALSSEIAKGDGRVKRKLNPWALTTAAAALVICLVGGAVLLSQGNPAGMLKLSSTAAPGAQSNGTGLMGSVAMDGGKGIVKSPEAAPAAPAATAEAKPATDSYNRDYGEGEINQDSTVAGADALTKTEGDRKIIYTASLVVETREFDKCMDTVEAVYTKYGGYRESSQEYGVPDSAEKNSGRTAVVSIRMPIGKYDAAMAEFKALGNVLSKNESTEDVSRQYVDTEARNKTLKMQRDQLYTLLAKADSMENIIALQNEISRLTVEIEQMTAQLNYWNDKVSYSTITVELRELVEPKTVKPVDPDLNSRMNGALNVTLNNMKSGLENFAVGFIGFLPWLGIILVIGGVVAAIAIPAVRKARRAARAGASANKKEE